MLKQISRFVLLSFLLSLVSFSANAQGIARAVLFNTNTDSFPQISAYLDAYDGAGNFIHGLGIQDVRIIEDQQTLAIDEIAELKPGAQYVVAINMGPVYAIQNSNGFSRYERIQEALQNWIANYPPDTTDILSLVTNEDVEGLNFSNPSDWLSLFQSYEPNFDFAVPSLDVLSQAIVTASNPASPVGAGNGLLFITPLPSQDNLAALPSLVSLAKQGQVRVDVWMVSSRGYFDSPGALQLSELAAETGGQFFAFSGNETLPPVDPYVDQLRYTYALSYTSKISSGDIHQIAANISTSSLTTTSNANEFSLSVQPPNPILVSPPIEIIRSEQVANDDMSDVSIYNPVTKQIEILTEFPDEYQRSLEKSILIVDGKVVAENTTPPFNTFTWDLSDFIEKGTHVIKVEVVDVLGLRGATIEHQVEISIEEAPINLLRFFRQNLLPIVGISLVFVISLLVLLLIVRGKIQPKSTGRLSGNGQPKKSNGDISEHQKPEQPSIQEERAARERISQWMNRLSLPKRQSQDAAKEDAYLELSSTNNGEDQVNRIPISQRELTIGKDSALCTINFDDPSLESLHARILQDENGMFNIADEGSVAGTWVNYEPVSSDGKTLNHGDIIHVGRINIKFKYTNTKLIPKPKVSPQEAM